MGEQPVFVEGEPPDFSLLQRLLCLEPEPWRPLLLPPSPGGAATTGPRRTATTEPPEGGSRLPPEPPRRRPPGAPGGLPAAHGEPRHPQPHQPQGRLSAGVTRTGSGTDTGTGAGMGIDNGTGTEIGTSTGTGTDSGTGIGTNSGSGRRRKQANPQRGADPRDPSFRGVTLRVRLAFPTGDTGGCRLLITARGHRIPTWSRGSSSSDDDAPLARGHKRCTSCKTLRTPMWRTAEDGTVLCNACGIRYKKYRVRCQRCWNIPGKSGTPQCPRCPQRPTRPAGAGGDSEDPTAAG